MIALVHNVGWLRRVKTSLCQNLRVNFQNCRVDPHAVFIDECHDYLFDYRGPIVTIKLAYVNF